MKDFKDFSKQYNFSEREDYMEKVKFLIWNKV